LKKSGKAEDTIKNVSKKLYALEQHTNLEDPEAVKTFVATAPLSNGYKRNLIMAYEHYVKLYGLTWTKPKYHEKAKMPKIPQERKIELIRANSPLKLRTAIAISKDTGLRPVELMRITLRNLDLTNGAIYPETAKHGSSRVLKLKNSAFNLLNKYLANRNIGLNENIFGTWNSDTYGKWFRHYRNKTSEKMQDPSIRTIRLYDLRHYFATMLYHNTRDILFVKQQMGHKKIETTLVYTQLLQFEKDDNYTCKVAQNVEEATELIENGFEYITEMDGLKLFRKRK
jgi:integrase